jgi:hypothetical protein
VSVEYRAVPFVKHAAGDERYACVPQGGATIRLLSARALQALEACAAAARPLDEHAATLAQSAWPGSRAEALEALKSLARLGLLRPLAAGPRTAGARAARSALVATLGIPTRNRHEALRLCLGTYADNLAAHGRAARLVVFDDSDEPATREANRAALRAAAGAERVRAFYSGPAERLRFARHLARRTGAPARVVESALLNRSRLFGPGALRNALLLDTAGQLGVMADDDTRCAVGRYPAARAGTALAAAFDFEVTFLPRGWEAHPPVAFADVDFLALHEELLGRPVPACVPSGTALVNGWGTGPGPDGRVGEPWVVTSSLGYVGHSGMESPGLHLLLGGERLEGLFRQVRRHGPVWRSAQLLRTVAQAVIAERGVCMSGSLGFDNRRGLPPFLPVFRNEDCAFGRMLDATLPGGRVGYLPWVVHHERPKGRSPLRNPEASVLGRPDTGEVVSYLVGLWPRSLRREWDERLASLGRWFKDLSAIGPEPLLEVLALGQARALAALARMLERQLTDHPEAPAVWRQDLERQLGRLRRTMADRQAVLPYDLPGSGAPAERIVTLRRVLEAFGELCLAWPALWAEAASRSLPVALPVPARAGSRVRGASRRRTR